MNATQYQMEAERTMIAGPEFEIQPEQWMVIWNAIGLAGEAGEVAELVKKGIFHRHGLDTDNLVKELGDCLWYIAALCTSTGLDLGEVMQRNIDKLNERYPNGWRAEDSQNRKEYLGIANK